MLVLALLPVALRLLLLPNHPPPVPDLYDEFGHLFVADTLKQLRLANPAPPLPQFFETFFILQQPTHSSIYPLGQGLALALGWTIFGTPWAGVLLCVAAFCSLTYWMLRAWLAPGWALLGGVLAVFEFGPLNQWTNSYWGGAFTASAGCLVFGALPRLRNYGRKRDALLLGLGVAMHLLSRPYESIFLAVAILLFWIPEMRGRAAFRRLEKPAFIVAATVVPAIGLIFLQNKQVTGSWTTLPYTLSQYQYGVPAPLTFQAALVPHRPLTREQEMDYRMQRGFHSGNETVRTWLLRLLYRIRYYRFFFYAPLYLAVIAFLASIRDYHYFRVALAITLFAAGVNFFPEFQFHYMAAATCLFVLIAVAGLRQIAQWPYGAGAARAIIYLCVAQFVFWYGCRLFANLPFAAAIQHYDVWDSVDHRNPNRIAVSRQIDRTPGKLLVFVRYLPNHIFQDEWVYNAADMEHARVILARDLGDVEDEKLLKYYPDRKLLLLEPDFEPPELTRWQPAPSTNPDAPAKETPPALRLQQVR